MRRSILRLFREFRELEYERDRSIELQTRMAEQSRLIDWLKDELTEARRGELRATQALANYASQLKFGVAPFSDAPTLPDAVVKPADVDPPPPQYVTAQSILTAKGQQFAAELRQRLQQLGSKESAA